jgi:hypothetical protein
MALAALVLSVALLPSHVVHASVLSEFTVINETTENGGGFGGELGQFNPSLGTLESVNLTISGEVNYYVAFAITPSCPLDEADGGECGTFFSFSTGYSFNAPGFPLTDFMEDADFFALLDFDGFAYPSNLSPQSQSDGPGIFYEGSPASLSGYIGLGDVGVIGGISEDSDYCDDEDGLTCTTFSHTARITTSLTYTYSPIPEPGAIWLFMASLSGMALIGPMMRRRHARCRS